MIEILIALIVLGLLLYIVRLLPIDETIKKIIYAIAICLIVIYAIRWLGAHTSVLNF